MVLIIKKVYECIKVLYNYGVYHTDIKPANISFHRNAEYDEYEPKLIDFGGATTDYKKILSYTPFYYNNNSSRKYKVTKCDSKEERLKADLYSLAVIML